MMPYIPQKQDNFGKAAALGKLIASVYSMGAGGAGGAEGAAGAAGGSSGLGMGDFNNAMNIMGGLSDLTGRNQQGPQAMQMSDNGRGYGGAMQRRIDAIQGATPTNAAQMFQDGQQLLRNTDMDDNLRYLLDKKLKQAQLAATMG